MAMIISLTISVLAALGQTVIGQSFTLVFDDNRTRQTTESDQTFDDGNPNISTIVVIEGANPWSTSADLSQSTMDIITIVWYIATFLALSAFFLLMACSDRRRGSSNNESSLITGLTAENSIPAITPTPSYSQFAPPSYETVMKMQNCSSVFVIPVPSLTYEKESSHQGSVNSTVQNINFYIVHEIEK